MQKQKRKTNHIHRAACALLAGLALKPGAFDWMRLGRQHDRGGKEE